MQIESLMSFGTYRWSLMRVPRERWRDLDFLFNPSLRNSYRIESTQIEKLHHCLQTERQSPSFLQFGPEYEGNLG